MKTFPFYTISVVIKA